MATVDLMTRSTEIDVRIQQTPATKIPDHVMTSVRTAKMKTEMRIAQWARTGCTLLLTQHTRLSKEMLPAFSMLGTLFSIRVMNTMMAEN
eukprot:754202-Hanusia_phi.AAC.1